MQCICIIINILLKSDNAVTIEESIYIVRLLRNHGMGGGGDSGEGEGRGESRREEKTKFQN